jgi:hypothetical protein
LFVHRYMMRPFRLRDLWCVAKFIHPTILCDAGGCVTCAELRPLVQGYGQAVQPHIVVVIDLQDILRIILLLHNLPERHGLV